MNSRRTDCVEDRIKGRGSHCGRQVCRKRRWSEALWERHTAELEFTLEAEGRMQISGKKKHKEC